MTDNSTLERSIPYPDRFQLIGFIVPGTVFITGCVWGINGKIFSTEYTQIANNLSFASLIVLIILAYVIGEVLSGLSEWIRYSLRHTNLLKNKPAWIIDLTDRPYYNVLICSDHVEGTKHVLFARNYMINRKNKIISLTRLKFIFASILLEEYGEKIMFQKESTGMENKKYLFNIMKQLTADISAGTAKNENNNLTRRLLQNYYQHIKQTIIQHNTSFASELKSSQAKEKMFASMMLAGILVFIIAMVHCLDPACLNLNTTFWYENPLFVALIYAAIAYMSYKMYLRNRWIYVERLYALYYMCIKENGTLDSIKSILSSEEFDENENQTPVKESPAA